MAKKNPIEDAFADLEKTKPVVPPKPTSSVKDRTAKAAKVVDDGFADVEAHRAKPMPVPDEKKPARIEPVAVIAYAEEKKVIGANKVETIAGTTWIRDAGAGNHVTSIEIFFKPNGGFVETKYDKAYVDDNSWKAEGNLIYLIRSGVDKCKGVVSGPLLELDCFSARVREPYTLTLKRKTE